MFRAAEKLDFQTPRKPGKFETSGYLIGWVKVMPISRENEIVSG